MTVDDLKFLIKPILEVSFPKLTRDLNRLRHKTSQIAGFPLQTLDNMSNKDEEFKTTRILLKQMCHILAKDREEMTTDEKAFFFFPPKLDRNEDLPTCTARKIMKNPEFKITINVWIQDPSLDSDKQFICYTVKVPAPDPPHCVIEAALNAQYKSQMGSIENDFDMDTGYKDDEMNKERGKYVLKVCGREEYMMRECCIHTYEYVRYCIDKEEVPQLQLALKENILKSIPDNKCVILQKEPPVMNACPASETRKTSWDLPGDHLYSIKIRSFPAKGTFQPGSYVQAQLFHGTQPLSKAMKTSENDFNQTWEFDIPIENLPRCARLCLVACATEKNKATGINWVNMQVFDHNRKLVTGRQVLKVTNFPETCNRTEYPIGSPGSNPDRNANELVIEIMPPCEDDVYYPTSSYIDSKMKPDDQYHVPTEMQLKSFEMIDRIVHKDPLEQMGNSEKRFLWEHRELAMDYQPNILPRVIQCVNWSERHDVFKLYGLLKVWHNEDLSLVTALQLLGPDYPDKRVRALAVKVLEKKLSNELFELFMPQLVQAVKLESYQYSDLSCFLLRRALSNRRLGHRYFWHLRSEVHNPMSRLRFAPLLEAYCLYCGSYLLDSLYKEVKSLNEYRTFSRKTNRDSSLDLQLKTMKSWLETEETRTVLENQTATLDQNVELGQINVEDCKVMSSKMKPLWLSWKNKDPSCRNGGDIRYIIKDGDDLRQDMLVLQLIRLMDMIWKYTSRDYCITSYECMSMDDHFGIIEVVSGAKTVCDIEMHKQTGVMATTSMHEWVYTESGGGVKYLEAVKKFTHSCAAFCVITYILGIGDRHSDNIMLKVTGELFHIDFGHFMNHKKVKYGVQRERSPFVLTKDFISVVTKGEQKVNNNEEFNNFLFICLDAYMTIRRNGTLFLTLLSLMMHCELPELQEVTDIDYCRKCLALDKKEHVAANNFLMAIMESYKGQWKTNIDWFLHRVNRVWQGMGSGS
ncbi:phosphatidylinositol 4,5-bisphosphate 3-kinase catalytic subunit alpha isoform-like isoform X2 [Ruditapes philippinarum]|uniref:phosphatidylinositol 4,5-bisphosphate 3-kinase catalytic subunit alpha isoform-like isoform X2 n=1 Tax=Ruditapes philippinarum TaxID=129788 RepID=UPI00295B687B|nr:phosphatidylinositol 4,5-bisphosphate 3-kinase catalytic subunit alpha isoform-like isoform X2 [Ruditapes philippinarum]